MKKNELRDLTKDELVNKCVMYGMQNTKLHNTISQKHYQIRNMRLRLKKIRDSMDFILNRPFTNNIGPGYTTKTKGRRYKIG